MIKEQIIKAPKEVRDILTGEMRSPRYLEDIFGQNGDLPSKCMFNKVTTGCGM